MNDERHNINEVIYVLFHKELNHLMIVFEMMKNFVFALENLFLVNIELKCIEELLIKIHLGKKINLQVQLLFQLFLIFVPLLHVIHVVNLFHLLKV